MDPPHFDPHLTFNFKTHFTLSFVYSKLVRYQGGPGFSRAPSILEPDLAERWEAPDDTTYVFHLRKGVKWHNKPPVNGRELVAEDVQFTFDRFLAEQGESAPLYAGARGPGRGAGPLYGEVPPQRALRLAGRHAGHSSACGSSPAKWCEQFGDLKKAESAIGTGPFILERYEPNVKTVFKRHPEYFLTDQPYVDGVEWLVLDDPSTALAMYRTGQLDCGPGPFWSVRQHDLEALKQSHPHLIYRDFLSHAPQLIYMRTDKPPFNDVRVRHALSQAIDRQGLIEAVRVRGEPTGPSPVASPSGRCPSINSARERSTINTTRRRPNACWRRLVFPRGLKRSSMLPVAAGPDLVDAVQLVQRYLKDVGIEAELKLQEFGAFSPRRCRANSRAWRWGLSSPAGSPIASCMAPYTPDSLRNSSHVNDPTLTAMLKEQRRTKDLAARKQLIFAIQRYEAEQQYYVYLYCRTMTGSHQPYVKNYVPNFARGIRHGRCRAVAGALGAGRTKAYTVTEAGM